MADGAGVELIWGGGGGFARLLILAETSESRTPRCVSFTNPRDILFAIGVLAFASCECFFVTKLNEE